MCGFAVEACALGARELSAIDQKVALLTSAGVEGAHRAKADLKCRHALLNEGPWFLKLVLNYTLSNICLKHCVFLGPVLG